VSSSLTARILSSIRNGSVARKKIIWVSAAPRALPLFCKLIELGFIAGYQVYPNKYAVLLRYNRSGYPTVRGAVSLSTISRRIYVTNIAVKRLRKLTATFLVSTSRGILTDVEAAQARVGGELLCVLY
jgi:small subunit ribosomal protein S8